MPELSFDSKEALPEDLREHAKEANGKFVINVVPASKIDEFRNNNVNLAKERDSLKESFAKVQPIIGEDMDKFVTEFNSLLELKKRAEAGEIKDNKEFESALAGRTNEMKGQYEGQVKQLQSELQKYKVTNEELIVSSQRRELEIALRDAAMDPSLGVSPSAYDDIIRRGMGVFKYKEGKILPFNGTEVVYGADGSNPMTPKEWIGKLHEQAPHLFKNSSGGGAGSSTSGGGTGGALTPAQIAKMDPAEYRKLRAEGKIR